MTNIPFTTCALFDQSKVVHGFFGRRGGVSKAPYDTLNCGFNQDDFVTTITKNFQLIAGTLNCKVENFVLLDQVHEATVHIETVPRFSVRPPGDAMVTACPGLALSIVTADCVPVLLADTQAGIIAAVHSGWQSAFAGIIGKTIETMESLGAHVQHIVAAIGPCIQQLSYEVSYHFKENFLLQNLQNQAYFNPSTTPGKWLFNLPAYVRGQLEQKGVISIDDCQIDTFTNPADYFSHRYSNQSNTPTGRQLSTIYLKK